MENVNEICIHECLHRNPFTEFETGYQITHRQTTLEHLGDNNPNCCFAGRDICNKDI